MDVVKHSLRLNSIGLQLFMVLFAVYLVTASGRIDSGDGRIVFTVSQSLLEKLDVSVPPPAPDLIAFDAQGRPLGKAADLGLEDSNNIEGRNGNYYSPTGLGHSLLVLPLLALGRALAVSSGPDASQWMMEFVASMLFNPFVSAVSGLLVYLILGDGDQRGSGRHLRVRYDDLGLCQELF
jgi:hypothetical protein